MSKEGHASRKLVYIMGLGRSGSTLLDIILGNAGEFSSCGEVDRYTLRSGICRNTEQSSDRYLFWENFRKALAERNPKYVDFPRLKHLLWRREYHAGYLFDKFLNPKSIDDGYYQFLRDFYGLLFEHMPTNVLVDSSKRAGRAWHLARAFSDSDIEVVYVYLIRHPVAVVESFGKRGLEQRRRSWLTANIRYLAMNHLCQHTANTLALKHKLVTITWEELLQSPETTIDKIARALDLDLSKVMTQLANKEAFEVGNLFDGNRVRHEASVQLQTARQIPNDSLGQKLSWVLNRHLYPNS